MIVAVHGGATSAAYFDCPGHPELSLLRAAAADGYTVIALDRPGYGASAFYHDDMTEPDRRVGFACGAVRQDPRRESPRRRAFPAGALRRLRARRCAWPSTSEPATCSASNWPAPDCAYGDEAKAVISKATATSRPAGLRDLLWQPTELYPPEVLTGGLSVAGRTVRGRGHGELAAPRLRRDRGAG